jgi:protein-S-isoprenylcysteine O-methyltransferase Ste14
MKQYPLLIMVILAMAGWLLSRLWPMETSAEPICRWGGYMFLGCGIVLILLTGGQFILRKTTFSPTKAPNRLVTTGLYAISRNPMYLGMVLSLAGFQCVIGFLPGIILVLFYFLYLNVKIIPEEEKRVESVFGQEYWDYKGRTRRWI